MTDIISNSADILRKCGIIPNEKNFEFKISKCDDIEATSEEIKSNIEIANTISFSNYLQKNHQVANFTR
jgi:hypothetical protein